MSLSQVIAEFQYQAQAQNIEKSKVFANLMDDKKFAGGQDFQLGGGYGCTRTLKLVSAALVLAATLVAYNNLFPSTAVGPIINALIDLDYVRLIISQVGNYSVQQWRDWFITIFWVIWTMIPGTSGGPSDAFSTMTLASLLPQLQVASRSLFAYGRISFVVSIVCYILAALVTLARAGLTAAQLTARLGNAIKDGLTWGANKIKRD